MPRGEKRAGGRPKGSKDKHPRPGRMEEAAIREIIREMVAPETRAMTAAQIDSAKGFKFLVVRNKAGGKFKRVTVDHPLNRDDEILEVWEKDPDTGAYKDLMDRAAGKPTEHVNTDVTHHVGPQLERILAGMKRANGHG